MKGIWAVALYLGLLGYKYLTPLLAPTLRAFPTAHRVGAFGSDQVFGVRECESFGKGTHFRIVCVCVCFYYPPGN